MTVAMIFIIQFLIALSTVLIAQPIIKASNKDVRKTLVIVGVVMMFTSLMSAFA